MHTTRSDLSAGRIEADEGIRAYVARAPAAIVEATLITGTRHEQAQRAQPASETRKPRGIESASASTMGTPGDGLARLRDIICALFLIILLLPVFILLAVLIAVHDRAPPIFAHTRVGRNGRLFKCYKLRTMRCDAEERLAELLTSYPAMRREWEATHKLTNDPRVTVLGELLRRSSLDELPQLFNVLAGSMALVGPRPIVVDELRHYGRNSSYYLCVKPGLTGLWQVTGRSEVSYRRRVATDRLYARRKSFMLDFQILLATVPAVLAAKGAC